MSNVRATDWKMNCREKLEAERQGCKWALDENRIDPLQEFIDTRHAQKASFAIELFEQGSWGLCRECNKPIDPERLIALPYAEFCIGCQTKLERQNRFRVSRRA